MNLAKFASIGHRCDFSDRPSLEYSQSALGETEALTNCTNCAVPGPAARKPVPTNEMNATATTDILIIEDDTIMLEALAEWLQAAGYRVRKAANGRDGLAAVKLAAPALVVTDIYMPGTSGAVVVAELKQEYPEIPIIAISGLFNTGHGMDVDTAIALGAARALAKPFKRSALLRAVAELLGSPTR
jgi:CheY-like chemotaxis protein